MHETHYECKDEGCGCSFSVHTWGAGWSPESLTCPLCQGEVIRANMGPLA